MGSHARFEHLEVDEQVMTLKGEPITLVLARHGEVSWNVERRFLGHKDLPLTEEGINQAERLAQRLGNEPSLTQTYSSDLQRAVVTAQKVAETRGLEVIRLRELRELDFGDWEGLTFSEIKLRWGRLLDLWFENPFDYAPPGGESMTQLLQRIQRAMEKILRTSQGGMTLVVSHGGPIRLLTCLYMGWPLNQFWSVPHRHAAISIFRYHGGSITPVTLNDTAHLL